MIKQVVLGVIALSGVAVVSGIAFEQWSRWSVNRDYQPVGRLIEVDGSNVHLNCTGNGAPTVVFESGMGDSSASWSEIQPEIAKTNRVCSYDRVGILWSDRRSESVTATGIVARLHNVLALASEVPPYVMVGHSLGGSLVRLYAGHYPQDVVGVVLIDSSHPDQEDRFSPEVNEVNDIKGMDRALMSVKAATGIMRLSQRDPYEEIIYEDLADMYYQPQSMPAVFAEMDASHQIHADAGQTTTFGDLPLIVLSAGRKPTRLPPEITPALWSQFEKTNSDLQTELAALSTRGEQRIIADASHYIHWQDPEAVVQAIHDVIFAAQESERQD